jgi:hypothetical protein
MTRYRIQKRKKFWENLRDGAEYLCGFDFKNDLDWRGAEGSYWSYFLIFKDSTLDLAFELAKQYDGKVVTIPASEYEKLVDIR